MDQKTSVCNVKVQNLRPKYKNLKEWCEDKTNVYIGRKGIVFIDGERYPKNDSIWCNPFKITDTETREKVLEKYCSYIIEKIKTNKLETELEQLRGKNLGCWCYPEACHGDILVA